MTQSQSEIQTSLRIKQTITPSQALLILIEHYRDDAVKRDMLKRLYLSGANSAENKQKMKEALSDTLLERYHVSFDPILINSDPTRRYFETHLSYETVMRELYSVTQTELEEHLRDIVDMIPPDKMQLVQHVLDGESREHDILLYKEYADVISKIKTDKIFKTLPESEKQKLELVVKISFLGVYNAQTNPTTLPMNIYGTGVFSDAARGKHLDSDQRTTRNQQLGLMKGHMPLALDDIALSSEEIPYLKPSDQSRFVPGAAWVMHNFDSYVHPFSNSISGTMLCQLRNMAMFDDMRKNRNPFYAASFTQSQEKMRSFTKLLMSTMLYATGGHSLNEYSAPLSLPIVSQTFSTVLTEPLTLEALYHPQTGSSYVKSSDAFDVAIDDAIIYNKQYMRKRELHSQIKGSSPVQSADPNAASLVHLNQSKLTREREELHEILESPIYLHWINLIPELGYTKKLIESGEFLQAKTKIEDIERSFPLRKHIPPQHLQECVNLLMGLKVRLDSANSKAKITIDYKERLKSNISTPEVIDESVKENQAPRRN